jgi:hypothetical protein
MAISPRLKIGAMIAVLGLALAGCPGPRFTTPKQADAGEGGADVDASAAHDAGADSDGGLTTAGKLRARFAACAKQISAGLFQTDNQPTAPANVPICELGEAVYWQADFDVDCDGEITNSCNIDTDPDFQNQTSALTSEGQFLDAESLPYVVIPQPSPAFDFGAAGLELGTVVMVVYKERIDFGIIGDTGPANIIGEGSYALARALGIDPDPRNGGTSDPVLYVAFKGKASVVKKNEDHAEAVNLGKARAIAVIDGL